MLLAFVAVVGPGVLAGLSDDDPAGITTYSILGAKYGYQLLWVLALSTAALVIFHELSARMGIVTKKGLLALVRDRYGSRGASLALSALVVANFGTLCAEFAGVAAGMQLLAGVGRGISVPIAAIGVSALVLRGSFHRVEHVLLALSAVFVAYILSGFLAHPDWGAAAKGLVVPSMPATRDAALVAVATLGTTLAPWGLAFIQSYAVDKRLSVSDLRYERIDVIAGAVMTGVIGLFIVVACAATLHVNGIDINDARDAAQALEPLAGGIAATLFGLGFVGAALLAAGGGTAVDRLFDIGGIRGSLRHRRHIPPGPALLWQLLHRRRRGGGDRSDPVGPARFDSLPLSGAQRGPAAGPAAVHAQDRQGSRGHGPAGNGSSRFALDRRRTWLGRDIGRRPGGPDRALVSGKPRGPGERSPGPPAP